MGNLSPHVAVKTKKDTEVLKRQLQVLLYPKLLQKLLLKVAKHVQNNKRERSFFLENTKQNTWPCHVLCFVVCEYTGW